MDRERFKQLFQLAHGGDMNAKADLYLEFDFAFDHDALPAFMNPPALPVSPASSRPCKSEAVADQQIKNRKSEIKNADLPNGGRP